MKKILLILIFCSTAFADDFTRKTTWVTSDLITASKLNADPDETARVLGTSSNGLITNGNIKSTAAVVESKILFSASAGHDHDGIDSKVLGNNSVFSSSIVDDEIVNADINSSADIVSSKIAFSVSGWDIDGTTVTSSATELNLLTGVTGTVVTESTTLGGDLAGTLPDPTIASTIKRGAYFEPDSTCVIAVDNGSLGIDLSSLHNAISLTGVAEGDLVAGIVSPNCYTFDGSNDYLDITYNALFEGMANITIEVWVHKTATGQKYIISTPTDDSISLYFYDTNVAGRILSSTAGDSWDVAHGLSDDGIDQDVYIVVTCVIGSVANIYINGVDVGDGDGNSSGIVSFANNNDVKIGADKNGANYFPGKIDGVRILRRVMSAAEILARYNAFKG